MRRPSSAVIAFVFVLAAGWSASVPSLAQGAPQVTLTLASQSAWNSPDVPLDLRLQATNLSDSPLGSLTLVLSIWTPARSRSAYELSLKADAPATLCAYPFAQSATLEPGQTTTFRIHQALGCVSARSENAIYPLRIDLLSDITPVATLRTPMIFLFEQPTVPLNLAWTWVLSEPMQYGPDGVFQVGPIEQDIAAGGRLDSIVSALQLAGGRPLDLVVSSVLVDELTRMAAGYRIVDASGTVRTVEKGSGGAADAAKMLASLTALAGHLGVELVTTPYADPSVTAAFHAGLGSDFTTLLERGRALVTQALGTVPRVDVFRPPGSQMDQASVARLGSRAVRILLLDPNLVPPPADVRFSPPPVAKLAGRGDVSALLPDDGVANVIATYQDDPRLAAHAALGELAADWLEFPGTPGRGAAVLFREDASFSPAFMRTFARLVADSSWLHPMTASTLVGITEPSTSKPTIPTQPISDFPTDYVVRLKAAKAELNQFRQTALDADPLIAQLSDDLLLAEAGTFVSEPGLGARFVAAVVAKIHDTYSSIQISPSVVTLTSRGGFIPVTIGNDTGYAMNVVLRVITDRRLTITGGDTQQVELPIGSRTFTFPVRAETTGRIAFRVLVLTPVTAVQPDTITERELIVRSTAYNRVALVITIGAAAFLLAWWGRRLLPRRRS
jgi:hypothetical protein